MRRGLRRGCTCWRPRHSALIVLPKLAQFCAARRAHSATTQKTRRFPQSAASGRIKRAAPTISNRRAYVSIGLLDGLGRRPDVRCMRWFLLLLTAFGLTGATAAAQGVA